MSILSAATSSIFAFVLFSRIQLIMSLTKIWSLVVVPVIAAVAPRGAFAQPGATTVTCLSSFDWVHIISFIQFWGAGSDSCLGGSPSR